MKKVRFLFITILLGSITQIYAQKESALIGKWNVEFVGEDDSAIIEFKNEGGNIIGYMMEYTDNTGEKFKDNSKVHTSVLFDGKKGKSKYTLEWEGEAYETNLKFELANPDIIMASYSYYGFKSKEIWRRIR